MSSYLPVLPQMASFSPGRMDSERSLTTNGASSPASSSSLFLLMYQSISGLSCKMSRLELQSRQTYPYEADTPASSIAPDKGQFGSGGPFADPLGVEFSSQNALIRLAEPILTSRLVKHLRKPVRTMEKRESVTKEAPVRAALALSCVANMMTAMPTPAETIFSVMSSHC